MLNYIITMNISSTAQQHCNEFNKIIRDLIAELSHEVANDNEMLTLVEKLERIVNTASRADETFLIRNAGIELYKRREQIKIRNEEYFTEQLNVNEFTTKYDDATRMFDLIKGLYQKSDTVHRDVIYNKVCTLLRTYCKYLLECRR